MLKEQEIEKLLAALSNQPTPESCQKYPSAMAEIEGACFIYPANEKSWPLHVSFCPNCDGDKRTKVV